jgi:hypothetical protein
MSSAPSTEGRTERWLQPMVPRRKSLTPPPMRKRTDPCAANTHAFAAVTPACVVCYQRQRKESVMFARGGTPSDLARLTVLGPQRSFNGDGRLLRASGLAEQPRTIVQRESQADSSLRRPGECSAPRHKKQEKRRPEPERSPTPQTNTAPG